MSNQTYSEKLQDPRWHLRRAEIFERKGRKCADCGYGPRDGGPLQVHHLHYIKGREPWEYDDEHLIPLCDTCHGNRQSIEDEAKHELALLFGKMSVWQVYELGKAASRLRAEKNPTCVLVDHRKPSRICT